MASTSGEILNDSHALLSASIVDGSNISGKKSLKNSWIVTVICTQLTIAVFLEVLVFLMPLICAQSNCKISPESVYIFVRGIFWFIHLALDRYVVVQHNASKQMGYFDFHKKTHLIRRGPFYIYSSGNVLLMFVMILKEMTSQDPSNSASYGAIKYLSVVITLEFLTVLPIIIKHLISVIYFIKEDSPPDVFSRTRYNVPAEQSPDSEIGMRDENDLEELLERQADTIIYLKFHNDKLSQNILSLQAEIAIQQGRMASCIS